MGNANLFALSPRDMELLAPGSDDQEPPTFSFEEDSGKEDEDLSSWIIMQ